MDYVILTAIMTFFILLYFLNTKEGYTDSYINKSIENIEKTKGNVNKTIDNIKILIGKNKDNSYTIDIMGVLDPIYNGITSYKKLKTPMNQNILNEIEKQKGYLNTIQNNIGQINLNIKDAIESINVSTTGLNDSIPMTIPLLDALNNLLNDLNTVNNNLKQIPDN